MSDEDLATLKKDCYQFMDRPAAKMVTVLIDNIEDYKKETAVLKAKITELQNSKLGSGYGRNTWNY
jgi:hypothetical protein